MSEPEHIPQSFPFSNEEKSWQEHRWAEAQKVPERIEDTAKFLATMISLSLTLALTLVEKPIAVPKGAFPTVLVALACWMLSILLAFLVLMPRHYRHVPDSTEDYRRMHKRVVNYKYGLLIFSVILFLGGFVLFFLELVYGG